MKKLPTKVTEAEIKEFKRLRSNGLSYYRISKICGRHLHSIQYHLDEKYNARCKQRCKNWTNRNRNRVKAKNKKWRENNPIRHRKLIVLATVRHGIKQGFVTKNEIEQAIKEGYSKKRNDLSKGNGEPKTSFV